MVGQQIRAADTADQTPTRREPAGHLHENGRQQHCSSQAVTEPRVQIRAHPDCKCTKGLRDLGVGREALGGVMVYDVADQAEAKHGWSFLPGAVIYYCEAGGEGKDEEEGVPEGVGWGAGGGGCGRGVYGAVDGGANWKYFVLV